MRKNQNKTTKLDAYDLMTIHFIGAGPGASDLITLRGLRFLQKSPVCIYAGSLIPHDILQHCPPNAEIYDSASMNLDAMIEIMHKADAKKLDVARLQSGDLSLYSAIGEQIRRLDHLAISYDLTPGVAAYSALAANLGCELTLPNIVQTVILTRTAMKASPMPEGEHLAQLAKTGALLAIHLSARNHRYITRILTPIYGPDCPVILAYRVSWPQEQILRTTLCDLATRIRAHKITRTALFLIGPSLNQENFHDSALYGAHHRHLFRPKG